MFLIGHKFLTIAHESGALTPVDVMGLYLSMVDGIPSDSRQNERIEKDKQDIANLPDDTRYFVVIRRRTGEDSGTETVKLYTDFGVYGRYAPVFSSRFVIWDHQSARELHEILVALQTG